MTDTPLIDRRRRGPAALPRVDALVPCYGYGHLLSQNVASLCSQRGVDVRVVIVDDASPDDTAEVAARLAATDSRVEVVRHEVNRGHIATYNHALSLVEGDYVTLVSADDVVTDGALARATSTMERHPEVGFVYGRVRSFTGPWVPPRSTPAGARVWSGDEWLAQRCRRAVNVIASPEVVVRASTHRLVGGYEPSLPHTADLHLWLRLASVAHVAYLRGCVQAGYRVHPHSLQRTVHSGPLLDIGERWIMFQHLFAHAWADRPDADALLLSAREALHREALERARRALERRDPDLTRRFSMLAEQIRIGVSPELAVPSALGPRSSLGSVLAGVGRRGLRSVARVRRELVGT